nr:hypothetical protein [Propylenella binzhouense]
MQIVVLGLAAYGAWYLYKGVKKQVARVDREVRDAEKQRPAAETLEYDPDSQTYRVRKKS